MTHAPGYVHDYQLRHPQGRVFLAHIGVWTPELNKFAADRVETEKKRWLKFFTEAEDLNDDRPMWMQATGDETGDDHPECLFREGM